MTVSWRQLLLCGAGVALVGVAGYSLYKYHHSADVHTNAENVANGETKAPARKKNKKKKSASGSTIDGTSTASTSSKKYEEMLPPELRAMFRECDRPLSELLELPVEAKQQVFYGLLMKGEMHMKMPGMMDMALECFSKAVSMVPNPGEVVAALERTLPPPVFNALLDKIQLQIQSKSAEYYASLAPAGANVKFVEESVEEPGATSRKVQVWRPTMTADAAVGATLWEEDADASALLWRVDNPEDHCEYCLRFMDESRVACPACSRSLYCSSQCCEQSAMIYHAFFCKPAPSTEEALGELHRLSRENESSMSLFMLRYVAFLLSEELRGNGAAQNGPFAHYDHLKSVFRAPNDTDRAEAKLLRTIFSGSNKNVADFLSDEIYASMKYTLARSLITIQPKDAQPLSRMESHVVESPDDQTIEAASFFPVAAHLAHSCDPNAMVVCDSARHVRIAALKNLKAGEPITLSYLPFAEGTSTAERKLHLMRLFDLECRCDLCEADLAIN